MSNPVPSRPYADGLTSGESGVLKSACPYPAGSQARHEWLVGYETGKARGSVAQYRVEDVRKEQVRE